MILRDYQQRVLDALYSWWLAHPGADQVPLLVLPTGAGKSVVIAELERLLWEHWPEDRPRTVIIVPSKELAEQNAAKLHAMLPTHLTIGYYSAAIGQKVPTADVIVATIGSIYKAAALLGRLAYYGARRRRRPCTETKLNTTAAAPRAARPQATWGRPRCGRWWT